MTMFIIQTLIWFLLAFFVGLLIGRFIKGILCPKGSLTVEEDATPTRTPIPTPVAGAGMATAASAGSASLAADVDDNANEGIEGIDSNNLQIIEGIGPKMESILHENGITTWAEVASKSPGELKGLLDKYGDRYRIIDPAPWIEQARLASEGKVDELIALQKEDELSANSKLENLLGASNKSGFSSFKKDDLKIVEGIGPKIEGLCHEAGIMTWKDLSNAQTDKLQDILSKAGPNFRLADPETWPTQADMADKGEWDKLKEFQDILQGGRTK